MSIISRLRGRGENDASGFGKLRSSSLDCNSDDVALRSSSEDRRTSSPYVLDSSGVIKASLTIPVQLGGGQHQPLSLSVDHSDIPFIEDAGLVFDFYLRINFYARLGFRCTYALEGSYPRTPEIPPRRRHHSTSGSDSSGPIQPIKGSISIQGYDSALGSSATISSPPPNSFTSSTDLGIHSSPPSWASTPPTSPDSANLAVNYIPDEPLSYKTKRGSVSATLQKVSFSITTEPSRPERKHSDSSPSSSKVTPSISHIGSAVLRSRTADFERIAKAETSKASKSSDKKKYTKRRYTDSRHPTRHIPDSETLETNGIKVPTEGVSITTQAGPVYKRRELISSVPSK